MYRWRKLNDQDRVALLEWRKRQLRPWHSPPHFVDGPGRFHVTAACYDHANIIGKDAERMAVFCEDLLAVLDQAKTTIHAWCVLPNHYHLLVDTPDLRVLLRSLGLLHGRTSFDWNGRDGSRGRKVWCAPADRQIRGENHFWATLNYIHHNPVKHGWAALWQEWPFSSAESYLAEVGREGALRRWKEHPILDYGAGWDD